jgi:hypothetical protein
VVHPSPPIGVLILYVAAHLSLPIGVLILYVAAHLSPPIGVLILYVVAHPSPPIGVLILYVATHLSPPIGVLILYVAAHPSPPIGMLILYVAAHTSPPIGVLHQSTRFAVPFAALMHAACHQTVASFGASPPYKVIWESDVVLEDPEKTEEGFEVNKNVCVSFIELSHHFIQIPEKCGD